MRIVHAHNQYQQLGGEDVSFAAETALLRQHGHEVVKYTDDNRRIDDMGGLAVAAQTLWSVPTRHKLLGVLRDARPHVVHFHNTFLLISPSAYYACQAANVPVVQTLRNYRLACPTATFFRDGQPCEDCLGKTVPWPGVLHGCWRDSRVQTSVVTAMLAFHNLLATWQKQVDIYVALTQFARQKFIEGGVPAEKILIKPNLVYPDPGPGGGTGSYVLFVGRLSQEKGARTLIRAWWELKNVPLKVAGDGPLMKEVQGAESAGLEILGWRSHDEVLTLIKGARFIVFPSEWYEGFPLTIAEAFACGVPVITSRLGAMAEIVDDGHTGMHIEPGNAEDLAAKVAWAWMHPKKMQEMGLAARREYEQKYSEEGNYRQLMEIYRLAIERARG